MVKPTNVAAPIIACLKVTFLIILQPLPDQFLAPDAAINLSISSGVAMKDAFIGGLMGYMYTLGGPATRRGWMRFSALLSSRIRTLIKNGWRE